MTPETVELVEVGPRDGLQNEGTILPVESKIEFVDALSRAGHTRIEVTAFVSPRRIPQLADAREVMSGIRREKGVRYSALVPNDEGMRRALADVDFGTPAAPLLANADAIVLSDGEACRDELIDHLTRGVDWITAVETMVRAGTDTFIEVGPGKVLSGLVRRIAPEATVIALDDITTDTGIELPA